MTSIGSAALRKRSLPEGSRLSRRRFLTGAAGGAAALALPGPLRGGGLTPTAIATAAGASRFASALPIPRVIDAPSFTLTMVETEVAVLPGRKTRMWTYGGDFPGPTIRRPVGETTLATFRHRLPARAGELTVHLHGGHNRSADDGQPGGLTESLRASLYCDISDRLSAR